MASFVLGLLSLFCVCVTALPGIICGFIGLSKIGESNGQLKGRGLAILGIVLSLLLTVVGGAGWMVFGGKQLAGNPMFKEIFGAGKAMIEAASNGAEIAAAVKAHAEANEGKLPGSLDELVATGALDASKLNHPADGTPGFWQLTQPAGTVLADLPARTVIARGGPITVQGESLEVVIYANGTVEPRDTAADASGAPPAESTPAPDHSDQSPGTTEVPAPVENPDAPAR